ncbi:hypothetical protein U1Q18_005367 [Sarracenia purpurea var. burkii]
MATGWRRAFCTTISRDREATIADKEPASSPRSCSKLGFFSVGSNPSTPRLPSQTDSTPSLRCRTSVGDVQKSSATDCPKFQCKTTTTTPKSTTRSPRLLPGSNQSSPRSPFSILKNSLRLFSNSCGVCLQSLKTVQGMAIYTAECSHAFHFPCIAAHVSRNGSLACPVCSANWRDVTLLAIHKAQSRPQEEIKAHNGKQEKTTRQEQPPTPTPTPPLIITLKPKLNQQRNNLSDHGREYDDDEPLLSPTDGCGCVPIPEVEDEVEEFQGFFVNHLSSSSDESAFNGGDSKNVEVSLMPEAAVVSVGRTHHAYAVVFRVKAPLPPSPPRRPAHGNNSAHFLNPSRRAPIDLVTVLDVSESMSGAKLQMLKRAMRLVISSLGAADRLSIVAFSASPKRLLPLRRMSPHEQRAARRIIDRLACHQGTNVAAALQKAAKILEDRRERNPVASIMLLSDGQDEPVQSENSNRPHGSVHVSSTRFAHIEIPVHGFGIGDKSGGYHFEPAEDAFAKCVGGLLSVVVQDLRIELSFASGSDPGEISAVYSCNRRSTVLSRGSVQLGDLYAEEERDLLVELRVPSPVIGSHHVLSVRCSYRDPATQEMINGREQALLVPRAQSAGPSIPEIERLKNLFITTRAVEESRRLIEHNDLSSAHRLLASTRASLLQSCSISADEYVRALEAELAELRWRRQSQVKSEQHQLLQRRKEVVLTDENGEPLTPTSAWRAADQLAKMAMMKKSLNRVSDLHGFENARF